MDIKLYEKNAKKHPDKQLEALAKVVAEIGWRQSVEVNQEGVIIVGHGRYLAWQKFKDKYNLPDIWIIDDSGKTIMGKHDDRILTEQQEMMWRLADNRLNESEWDMGLAIEELKLLEDSMFDLTGFDKDLIIEDDERDDMVPEDAPAVAKLGDIWALGRHRVMCGDSTKNEDVERLMEGKLANMCFTDPPYNVDYGQTMKDAVGYHVSKENQGRKILNDKMSDEQFDEFLMSSMANVLNYTDGACYVCMSSSEMGSLQDAFKKAGGHWSTFIIWAKNTFTMGMSDYQRQYEPILYGWREGVKKRYWCGARNQGDVWNFNKPTVSKLHPTMKPIELVTRGVMNSSEINGIVLDLFLGSGSTLIACEKTNRICFGMELDPKYVDTIIQRYVDYTGNEKVIKNGKEITWKRSKKTGE
jgi:DNA modification methylase